MSGNVMQCTVMYVCNVCFVMLCYVMFCYVMYVMLCFVLFCYLCMYVCTTLM